MAAIRAAASARVHSRGACGVLRLAGFLLAPLSAEQRICFEPNQVLRFESKPEIDKRRSPAHRPARSPGGDMEAMQQTVAVPEHALGHARSQFFEEGRAPEAGVSPTILKSWLRCRERGLDATHRDGAEHAGRLQLAESRERNRGLLDYASGVMEHVFEQIRASGSLVILSDPQGMILHSLGDAEFVDRANRVALQPGACWSEAARGTNARSAPRSPPRRQPWCSAASTTSTTTASCPVPRRRSATRAARSLVC
jgi:hypothetical protein